MALVKLGVFAGYGLGLLPGEGGQQGEKALSPARTAVQAPQTARKVATRVADSMGPVSAHAQQNATGNKAASNQVPPDWPELKRKEEQLARRELALRTLKQEVDDKLKRLKELEARISGMLKEAKVVENEKFNHLISVYSSMKAQNAAQALEKLEESTAVKILAGMRGRQAGEILNYVPPAKAARLSQALTEMQTPFGEQ